MNAFAPNFYPRSQWGHLESAQRPDANEGENLQLKQEVEDGETVFHLCDKTGEKVYLVVTGTPPSEDSEVLLQAARALENQMLYERNTRLPVY